ncbi:MAG TPA: pitrilysin family protein [Pyrinomonadaceae bacterium]|nr:pitrilysin family protein [Pyrinomonadaceae bacterium]
MMQTETFRREMPPPLAPRPLNLPESVETTLANGLTLALIEDKRLPLINFRLAFRSGDANDPAELPGLSDMMSHLLTEGTTTRTSRQIAEEIERLGATLSVGSSSDFTTIAASGLSVYANEILELVADVTLHATFPQNEVDLARENTQQMLIQQRAQPTFLASERMAQVMFGAHPYSRISPTSEMLDALTRDHLLSFRDAAFLPNNAVMIAVGDFENNSIVAGIEQLFSEWKPADVSTPAFASPPDRNSRVAYVIDRPGSAQSNIVIANHGITRTNPDYFPLLLMHTILGANASSRLFMNLREEKGYTYGAYSNLDARRLAGTFRATAEVRTAVTGASLREFFYELNRIRDEAVSNQEIANAKSYLTGVFPIRIETQDGLIDQLVSIKMFDLPDDFLKTYRDQVNAVTTEDIQRVAQTYVQPDRATLVVVGDAAEITEQIKPYSETIEFYDTEGNQKAVGSRQ